MLNLFYEEPDPDRWLPGDRYPRRLVRRIVRGRSRIGGQRRVFLNLCAGLDRIGVSYRVNDYRHAMRHPEELACIVGKEIVLDKFGWRNPILLGAATGIHPVNDPDLLDRFPIRRILVPGPWVEAMFEPYWGAIVQAWPVGIDTELWRPAVSGYKPIDVLLYDKVRWKHERYEAELIEPIRATLRKHGRSFVDIRYGFYREEGFRALLARCRTMIFLCEHETQGIAYQQALSCGVPILAWDRGGPWRDPAYYPHKVKFAPVSSVPYWDERCGYKFKDTKEFSVRWEQFWNATMRGEFRAREFIIQNLTLEAAAWAYVGYVRALEDET